MLKALAVVGFKKSGKTSLVMEMARELSARGRRVAALKFSHHTLDLGRNDTARLAGECVAVAGIGPGETSLYWSRARQVQDVLPLLNADIVLVEGGKSLTWLPRIVVLGTAEDESGLGNGLALATWGPGSLDEARPAKSIAELATLADERGFTLPGLDCGACGRASCLDLAREIVAGAVTPHACMAMRPQLAVRVGGQALSLNPFIDRVLTSTLRGLLQEFKGYVPGQKVEISFE